MKKIKLSKNIQLIFSGVILTAVILAVTVNFTDACKLESVELNDNVIDNFSERYGFDSSRSILNQPLDSLAAALINKKNIFKVEMSYALFNGIEISTNNFSPVAIILDQNSGQLYGLNEEARVVELDNCHYRWDCPVITSASVGKLYNHPNDHRVKAVIEQLVILADNNSDMFRLIDEIDFGNKKFLKVSIDGLDYRLKLRAESFLEDINKFVEFVSRFKPETEDLKILDLRFDDMIISCGAKG